MSLTFAIPLVFDDRNGAVHGCKQHPPQAHTRLCDANHTGLRLRNDLETTRHGGIKLLLPGHFLVSNITVYNCVKCGKFPISDVLYQWRRSCRSITLFFLSSAPSLGMSHSSRKQSHSASRPTLPSIRDIFRGMLCGCLLTRISRTITDELGRSSESMAPQESPSLRLANLRVSDDDDRGIESLAYRHSYSSSAESGPARVNAIVFGRCSSQIV